MERRIIQIMPADGWYARYKARTPLEPKILTKLACWALIEEDDGMPPTQRTVSGLDVADGAATVTDCLEEIAGFERFVHVSELTEQELYEGLHGRPE